MRRLWLIIRAINVSSIIISQIVVLGLERAEMRQASGKLNPKNQHLTKKKKNKALGRHPVCLGQMWPGTPGIEWGRFSVAQRIPRSGTWGFFLPAWISISRTYYC